MPLALAAPLDNVDWGPFPSRESDSIGTWMQCTRIHGTPTGLRPSLLAEGYFISPRATAGLQPPPCSPQTALGSLHPYQGSLVMP